MIGNPSSSSTSLDQLRCSLQALALAAYDQLRLFPSFVCVGDELASDFDLWRQIALEEHDFTLDQVSALASVDAMLLQMTEEKNMELWEDDLVLARHPYWQEVRARARYALRQFGWRLEVPPSNRSTYVGPPEC